MHKRLARAEKARNPLDEAHRRMDLAFPDNQGAPAESRELPADTGVSCAIALEFGLPELRSGSGDIRQWAALVSVPKAAVDKDDALP